MKNALAPTGRFGHIALAMATVVMAMVVIGTAALAESQAGGANTDPAPGGIARQGQVILNPEPDSNVQAPARMELRALVALEPNAGAADVRATEAIGEASSACPAPDGWQVVVVRGAQTPDVVRGRLISIMPPGC